MKSRGKALNAVRGAESPPKAPAARAVFTAEELVKVAEYSANLPMRPRSRRALSPPPLPTAKQAAERESARARHEVLKQLGASLRHEREQRGLSLEAAAQCCGINRAALSKLELGQNPNPTFETLWRYAAILGKQVRCHLATRSE